MICHGGKIRRSSILGNQAKCPDRTGNLAYNGFKVHRIGRGTWKLYIDLSVAPYAYYLDKGKPIGNSDKHKNFWDDRMSELIQNIMQDLEATMNGKGGN